MNAETELCVRCRHFGLYDEDSGRYYCPERRTYFSDLKTECEQFAPVEREEKRPE